MALSFPINPTTGQIYNSGSSAIYEWTGDRWVVEQPQTTTILSASYALTASYALNIAAPSFSTEEDWTNGGGVLIGDTGGGTPTLPTTTLKNRVNYRRVGPKTWQVQAVLNWTSNVGTTNGNGDYLFTLPNSLQFDTTIPTQTLDTNNIGQNTNNLLANCIPGSPVMLISDNRTMYNIAGVLPYTNNTYRLVLIEPGSSIRAWGSAHFQLDFNTNRYANWSFTFQST